MFELVVLLLTGHMWGSIGVQHLWARPCFSRIVRWTIFIVKFCRPIWEVLIHSSRVKDRSRKIIGDFVRGLEYCPHFSIKHRSLILTTDPLVHDVCEMQLPSSRIWTHVVMSIFYDQNHYIKGTLKIQTLVLKEMCHRPKLSVCQWSRRPWFNPKSSHTKNSKNGT